ncbi:MAG: 50S ribosomal protein L25/general stress protein Ctc [Actinomycetota bacterium]
MSEKKAHAELTNKIEAEPRTTFGKGVARKLRAAGKVPVVVYGHGTDPQHFALPAHDVSLLLRKANAILDLQIAGKSQLALVKDVQKDPVRQIIEHIDLVIIRQGEKVTVDVPIHLEGESFSGTTVNQDANTLSIEAEATNIPERIVIDIEGKEDGFHLLAKDVVLPTGSTLIGDPEMLIVAVTSAAAADLGESEETAAEAEAEAADETAAEAESE